MSTISRQRKKRPDFTDWYADAKQYYEEHGDLLVPATYVAPSGRKLGNWISWLRSKYNNCPSTNGHIPENEIAMLERIGMVWRLQRQPSRGEWMEQVRLYALEHGNLHVPYQYVQNGYALSTWLQRQRKLYRQGELTQRQIAELERCGMVWSPVEHREWSKYCELARRYRELHGDLLIPADYVTEGGETLGRWLFLQRERYFRRGRYRNSSPMPAEEIRELEEIGMDWNGAFSRRWEEMYNSVFGYRASQGRLPTVRCEAAASDGRRLGNWVSQQRRLLKSGKLDSRRAQRLRELGIE